ncbi:hypothetical protein [Rahnella perminowiae]|uniref:hypothetical protein n=1 Tax=Rahnella perminowiae TaxID=2816244 RepID=UPI001EE5D168|nr:hypothetical protein [Rahnella perminowiae]
MFAYIGIENNALALGSTASALNAAISGAIGNGSQQQQNTKEDQGAGYTCEGTREQCAVRDPNRGPGRVLNDGGSDPENQPNLGKNLTDAEKAELGGAGSGTPDGWTVIVRDRSTD